MLVNSAWSFVSLTKMEEEVRSNNMEQQQQQEQNGPFDNSFRLATASGMASQEATALEALLSEGSFFSKEVLPAMSDFDLDEIFMEVMEATPNITADFSRAPASISPPNFSTSVVEPSPPAESDTLSVATAAAIASRGFETLPSLNSQCVQASTTPRAEQVSMSTASEVHTQSHPLQSSALPASRALPTATVAASRVLPPLPKGGIRHGIQAGGKAEDSPTMMPPPSTYARPTMGVPQTYARTVSTSTLLPAASRSNMMPPRPTNAQYTMGFPQSRARVVTATNSSTMGLPQPHATVASVTASVLAPAPSLAASTAKANLRTSFLKTCQDHEDSQHKRERNRMHAQASRKRKKDMTQDLTTAVDSLKEENERLRAFLSKRLPIKQVQEKVSHELAKPTETFLSQLQSNPKFRRVNAKAIRKLKALRKNLRVAKASQSPYGKSVAAAESAASMKQPAKNANVMQSHPQMEFLGDQDPFQIIA